MGRHVVGHPVAHRGIVPVAPCQFRETFSHGIVKEEQGKISGGINKIEKLNLLIHGELIFRQFQGVGV